MSVICTWKPCDCYDDEREEIELSEEVLKNVQAIQEWWANHGENISREYYGIERVEENGDLVLNDVEDYLKKLHWSGDWLPEEKEEEEKELRELIPNWDDIPDIDELIRREREARKADEERRSKIAVTTKLIRPKLEEDEPKKTTRKSKKKEKDPMDLLKHNAMRVAVESVLKLLDSEDDELTDEESAKKSSKKKKAKSKSKDFLNIDDLDFGDDED